MRPMRRVAELEAEAVCNLRTAVLDHMGMVTGRRIFADPRRCDETIVDIIYIAAATGIGFSPAHTNRMVRV